jgi:hypothetical protein
MVLNEERRGEERRGEERRGSRPVDLLTIQPKGPVSEACNNA